MGYLNLPASDLETRPGVLVVDDEPSIRRCIAAILQDEYRVEDVESVDEAIVAYTNFRPDLIIIDYNMPVKNGLVAIEWIRDKSQSIPIICLSGNPDAGIRELVMAAGATVFVEKPFNLLELTGMVYEKIQAYQKGL